MSYSTVDELKGKYSALAKTSGLADVQLAARLTAASALINARLARRYVLPITPAPQVLKDIEMDLAFAAIFRRPWTPGQQGQEVDVARQVRREAMVLLDDLADGTLDLVDDAGAAVAAKAYSGMSSNTKGLTPAFSTGDPLTWGEPEPTRAEASRR